MTALLEAPDELDLSGEIDGFSLVKTSLENPQVHALRRAYFNRMKVAGWTESPLVRWFALAKGEEMFCVVGACKRFDGGVEVTDIYAQPNHEGAKAGNLVLQFLKVLVDAKKIPYFFGLILAQNKTGQRHFEKYFGGGPTSYCYIYGGNR